MIVENVRYIKYRVLFTDKNGVRRRWVRHAPAPMFLHEALSRELEDRDISPRGPVRIKTG